MSETGLTLESLGKGKSFPPFSTRECIQTLTPVSHGSLRRTINGALVHVGYKGYRKFHSTIACKDKVPPAFEGLWKGDLLKVGCIQALTLAVPEKASTVQLEREALFLHLYDITTKRWPAKQETDRWISLPSDFPGGFITYYPILLMMVKTYHLETDEWGVTVGWRLELEEP